jgi:hypothetical protein
MAEQSPAVDVGHPPSTLLRLVNPILSFLLRTPLAGPARKQLMVLNFSGRKTGRRYSIPLSAHIIDNDLYALCSATWKLNFRGGAPAEVVYDGKTTAMHGELIQDSATVSDLYLKCVHAYGVQRAQRMMGVKFRDQQTPTLEDFTEAVGRLHLAAVRLTPAE